MAAGKSNDEIRDRTRLPTRVVAQMRAGKLPHTRTTPKAIARAKPFGRLETTAEQEHRRKGLLALMAEEARRDEAYAKKTKTVECQVSSSAHCADRGAGSP